MVDSRRKEIWCEVWAAWVNITCILRRGELPNILLYHFLLFHVTWARIRFGRMVTLMKHSPCFLTRPFWPVDPISYFCIWSRYASAIGTTPHDTSNVVVDALTSWTRGGAPGFSVNEYYYQKAEKFVLNFLSSSINSSLLLDNNKALVNQSTFPVRDLGYDFMMPDVPPVVGLGNGTGFCLPVAESRLISSDKFFYLFPKTTNLYSRLDYSMLSCSRRVHSKHTIESLYWLRNAQLELGGTIRRTFREKDPPNSSFSN